MINSNGATDYHDIIADLRTRLAQARNRIEQLIEARRPFAYDAVTGNASAQAEIDAIDVEAAQARSEAETLALAVEEACKRQRDHDANLAAAERRRREDESRALCAKILEADKSIDTACAALRDALVRRDELIAQMQRVGVIHPNVVHALQRRLNVTSAMVFAGLHHHADIKLGPPNFRKPLEELDAVLRKPMLKKDDDECESSEAHAPADDQIATAV